MRHGVANPGYAEADRLRARPARRSSAAPGGPAQTLLALQAGAGNRAVSRMLSGDGPAPVQRRVYIRSGGAGWRQKTGGSSRKLHGTFGRTKVGTMMTDNIPRFFETKDEMSSWAKGEIDWMGYVERENTWVKVPRASFTVIGENHTATTMADIVKGLHTSRFLYEPYTENVAPATNPGLHAAVRARKQQKDTLIGRAVGRRAHEAEDLHPKVLRGLTGLQAAGGKVRGSPAELRLLGWAILDAATAPAAQVATYQANKAALDTLAATLAAVADGASQTVDLLWTTFTAFKAEYTAFAQQKIQQATAAAAPAHVAAFSDPATGWHLAAGPMSTIPGASGDYEPDPMHEKMQAEKARDLSLFLHMKKAKDAGDLLFGVGELHEKRLNTLMDAENIAHTDMTTFIAGQRARFTPP